MDEWVLNGKYQIIKPPLKYLKDNLDCLYFDKKKFVNNDNIYTIIQGSWTYVLYI